MGTIAVSRHRPREIRRPSRLVLHAPATNLYWLFIIGCVVALVALPGAWFRLWKEDPSERLLLFGALAVPVLVLAIAYFQVKARWLVADRDGLTITEWRRTRKVPWRDVRCLVDLGWLGGAPGAKRHYVELADGEFFTFLADTMAMEQLDAVREQWNIRCER